MILIKTPLRISFFGGGTDIPEWYEQNNGSAIKSIVVAPQGTAAVTPQGASPDAGSSKSAKLNGGGEYNYELIPLINYL